MLRSNRDYHHIRSDPPGQPPMNSPVDVHMDAPPDIPLTTAPSFVPPPPMGGRGFPMPHGPVAYPLPPPTPVPSPFSFVPAVPAPPFVPPLPESPPVDALPPPPPVTPSSAPTSPPSFAFELKTTSSFVLSAQPTKPTDPQIVKNIESMAEFAVKNGSRYEIMARAKHAGDPKFAFLFENDSGPESVINREFYKWKKKVYQLYAQVETEAKLSKHLELDNDGWESQPTSHMAAKVEKVLGYPEMSDMDMDMEDDLASPSPKWRIASTRPGSEPSTIGGDSIKQKQTDMPTGSQSSPSLVEDFPLPLKEVDNLRQEKRAHCRLTNDYTGALIDNYPSDTSEGSEDLETWKERGKARSGFFAQEQAKKGMMVSDQTASDHEPMANSGSALDTAISNLESNVTGLGQSAESVHLANSSPSQGARNRRSIADTESALEHLSGYLKKRTSERTSKEIGSERGRKRSRTYSRSRSRSKSRSQSTSRSQSPYDANRSSSPLRALQMTKPRSEYPSPQNDLSNGDEESFKETRKKGGKGAGSNICLNYVRGRCFRGDVCRLQHPDGAVDREVGTDQVMPVIKSEISPKERVDPKEGNGHGGLDAKTPQHVDGDQGPDGAGGMVDGKSQGSADPTSDIADPVSDLASLLPSSAVCTESVSVTADVQIQGSAAGFLRMHRETSGQLNARAADVSQVVLPDFPPFPQWDVARQSRIYSSHIGQSHNPADPHPALDSIGGFGFDRINLPGMFGMSPSSQATSSNMSHPANNGSICTSHDKLNSGSTFSGDDYVQGQPPHSGIEKISNLDKVYSHNNPGSMQSVFAPGGSSLEISQTCSHFSTDHTSLFQALSGSALHPVFPPPSTGVSPSSAPRHADSPFAFRSSYHGFSSDAPLSRQLHQSQYPHSYHDISSQHFSVSSVPSTDIYSNACVTLPSQPHSSSSWSMHLGSLGVSTSHVLDMPLITRKASSYSYALTTIPPLPSIIELPGASKLSTSTDQYDPLADSFDTGPSCGSFSLLKAGENGNFFGGVSSTLASRLENVSPGPDIDKGDLANINESAVDPAVGIVENVSPPEGDTQNWSLGQPVEAIEAEQGHGSSRGKRNHIRGLKLLRTAIADHVKEVLKPTWKEGRMSKDAFKSIVKKVVDKVTGALPSHHIPKSQEKVDQFMASSHVKISKLVQGYIDKYHKM